jgi:hypothetical protein
MEDSWGDVKTHDIYINSERDREENARRAAFLSGGAEIGPLLQRLCNLCRWASGRSPMQMRLDLLRTQKAAGHSARR